MCSRTARITLGVAVMAVALLLGACGDDPQPTAEPTTPPAEVEGGTLPDGEHSGFLVTLDASSIELDPAEMLSGDEAVEAARAAGDLPEDGTLPNDFYIHDPDSDTVTLPVAAEPRVTVYDCAAGCEEAEVAYEDLVSGAVRPFNAERALFRVTVAGGEVTGLSEIYFP
jgi:hypothetical protein